MNARKLLTVIIGILYLYAVNAEASRDHLIDENRIWVYKQYGSYESTFKMKFDGTKDIDGKTYHVFKTFDAQTSTWSPRCADMDTWCVEPHPEFYIREEDGKYYAYKLNKWHSDNGYYLLWNSKINDVELFSTNRLGFKSYDIDGIITQLTRDEAYKVNIDGEICNYYIFHISREHSLTEFSCCVSYIEGIGLFNGAFLPALLHAGGACVTNAPPFALPTAYHNLVFLDKVTDLEGNTLFDPKTAEVTAVKTIDDIVPTPDIRIENNMIIYTGSEPDVTLSVHDSTGRLIVRRQSSTIFIANLPAGTYFASVGNRTNATKFIR